MKKRQPQKSKWPLVSVIIPVYNYARFLAAAVESVLAQDYRPLEILVINDGSTDSSAEVAGNYPEVTCLEQPHQGVAAARNRGIRAAKGSYIAFLDGDDLWDKSKLRMQMDYLLARPKAGGVSAKMKNFLDLESVFEKPDLEKRLLEKDPIGTQTLLVRKKIFKKVGMFDTSFKVGDDTDWFFRAKDSGIGIEEIPQYLAFRRIHSDNLTGRLMAIRKDEMMKVLKNSIDRRRVKKPSR